MSNYKPKNQIGVGGFEFGEKEKEYLMEVIKSNRLTYGPWSQKFENLFAEAHDCKYGLFMNSGTSALHIAIAALQERYGWEDGDEVIVPAITFMATSNVVIHNRMKPIFVDIDSKTYNIDPSKIEAAITPRTRLILPVHLFGMSADMEPIMAIAKKHNLRVIEDSCEAVLASYKGKKVGSFGDVGCFSTYVAHFLVTGVGGLAITNDPDLAIMMRSMMNHGRDSIYLNIDDDKNKSPDELRMVVEKRFSFERLGHSFRATEMEAAIGVAQLEGIDKNLERRAEIAGFYGKNLADLGEYLQLPYVPEDRDHKFMMYPIVLKNEAKKDLVNFLEEKNIETRDMLPLINQPAYKKIFGDIENNFPVAKWINKNGFYVPCHPYLSGDDVQYIADTIHEFFEKKKLQLSAV